jgi:tetratricopeptide (TPR) repeat protein
MPPGHGVAPNAATGVQGVLSARRKKKGGPSNKGGKPNIQLIRNVIVGVAAVMLLLMLTSVVSKKSTPKKKPGGAAGAAAAGEATPAPAVPKALRGNRTDDEILREAERLYGTGSTYLREYQIADESLWTAVDFFHKAQAEMALVDPSKWPGFAREIDPKIAEAQGLLEQEFKDSKINYVREKQSGRYAEAIAEMERVMRMFPDRNDARHKFARDQIKIVRHLMEGGKSKFGFGGGDDG